MAAHLRKQEGFLDKALLPVENPENTLSVLVAQTIILEVACEDLQDERWRGCRIREETTNASLHRRNHINQREVEIHLEIVVDRVVTNAVVPVGKHLASSTEDDEDVCHRDIGQIPGVAANVNHRAHVCLSENNLATVQRELNDGLDAAHHRLLRVVESLKKEAPVLEVEKATLPDRLVIEVMVLQTGVTLWMAIAATRPQITETKGLAGGHFARVSG